MSDEGGRPLSVREKTLVRHALHVVAPCADQVRRGCRADQVDLLAVGNAALCEAAREFREELSHDFAVYARYRIRFAMLDAVRTETFQDRVQRAAQKAAADHWGLVHEDFNDLTIREDDARRRFRAIANGLLAATFGAGIDEAARSTGEDEAAERLDYARAVAALRSAMDKLTDVESALLLRIHRDRLSLKQATEALGIGYKNGKLRQKRALARLREELEALGVDGAPRPFAPPEVGRGLDARVPPAENDTGPPSGG